MLAVLTATAVFIVLAWAVGWMQGQASGRRSMRDKIRLAEMFVSHAKAMDEDPEHSARLTIT